MKCMYISLIAAASENNVIGNKGKLPWHLPDDMRHFKELTMGKPVIMGRKTFESIGTALPGRQNIVITRNVSFSAPECTVSESFTEAIGVATYVGAEQAFVIGGGEIYREALPHADRIYLTRVHATVDGDAFFPEVDLKGWKEVERQRHDKDATHAYPFTFFTYEKKRT